MFSWGKTRFVPDKFAPNNWFQLSVWLCKHFRIRRRSMRRSCGICPKSICRTSTSTSTYYSATARGRSNDSAGRSSSASSSRMKWVGGREGHCMTPELGKFESLLIVWNEIVCFYWEKKSTPSFCFLIRHTILFHVINHSSKFSKSARFLLISNHREILWHFRNLVL